jgi:hypothetical protein
MPQYRLLGIGEFIIPTVVAAGVAELLGGGEIGVGRFPRIKLLADEEAGAVEGGDG